MSNINSLSKGYNNLTPNIREKKVIPPTIPIKVNVEEIYSKIKMLHADGNLDTKDINKIIIELQNII